MLPWMLKISTYYKILTGHKFSTIFINFSLFTLNCEKREPQTETCRTEREFICTNRNASVQTCSYSQDIVSNNSSSS